jgi:hypothetical protein
VEEAEGVTSRVKHDPNVVLRLDFGWSRPAADGLLGCVCQVLDPDGSDGEGRQPDVRLAWLGHEIESAITSLATPVP